MTAHCSRGITARPSRPRRYTSVAVAPRPCSAATSQRPHVIPAVTTALDHASPHCPKPPNRWIGWPLALASFAISMFVATAAFSQAYSMRHYSGCGFGYGVLERHLWVTTPLTEAFAGAGCIGCAKLGAGVSLCRVGLSVAVLMWLGSWISTL
jgi:hypothetical protein